MALSVRETWHRSWLVPVALLILMISPVHAQNGDYNNLKASLIFRCARYTEWPKEKMKPGTPFVIGVMGHEEIAALLTDTAVKTTIKERRILVKQIDTAQEIAGCHAIFIGRSEMARQKVLLNAARKGGVLSFGETETFEKDGGIITFVIVNGTVKFTLNDRNRGGAGLQVSSEMKDLAYNMND